jgi:hypothetical protein
MVGRRWESGVESLSRSFRKGKRGPMEPKAQQEIER